MKNERRSMWDSFTSEGRALGFLNCPASKAEVEAALPTIRDRIAAPRGLQLFVKEIEYVGTTDVKLTELIQRAQIQGMRYVLTALLPNTPDRQTATVLAGVIKQSYTSPLYQGNEKPKGEVIYHALYGDIGDWVRVLV